MTNGRHLSGSLALLSEHDPKVWGRRFREGAVSAERPYGMEHLEHLGLTLRQAQHARGRAARKLSDVIDHRTGKPFAPVLLSTGAVAGADMVVALLDHYGQAGATLRRRHLLPWSSRPLAVLTCWLGEHLSTLGADQRRKLVSSFGGADLLTVWSENQVDILISAGFAPDRVARISFGVNADYFTPGPDARTAPVLAVGMDAGRDYGTLFAAVKGTGIEVDLVCKPENLAGLDVPSNVVVHGPVPHHVYRAMLRDAKVVVVPSHERAYPTGQSVVLEASATGACVITTDTAPMREYVTDGLTGWLVAPEDSMALREVLSSALEEPDSRYHIGAAARLRVEREFSSEVMWNQFAELILQRGWVRQH